MKKSGFTLVELILVVTILVILGTIAVISFKGYSASARDSVKITNLQRLDTALSLYLQKKETLPMPINAKSIDLGNGIVTYEGELSDDIVSKISYSGGYMDTVLNESYVYSISNDNKKHSVLTYLEGDGNIVKQVNASGRDNIFETGENVGVVLNSDNTPLSSDFVYGSATGNYNILIDGISYSGDKDFVKYSYAQLKNDVSLEEDLILYYDFESVTDDGKLRDLSGGGHHGEKVQNTSKYKFGNDVGVKGKSTYLDINNLITTDGISDFEMDNELTFSFWFKQNKQEGAYDFIMANGGGTPNGGYAFFLHSNIGYLKYSGDHTLNTRTPADLKKWTFITLTTKGTTSYLYVNGNKVTQSNVAFSKVVGSKLYFGAFASYRYNGNIDEAKIYNRTLSDNEIMLMYNQNKVD